MIGKSWNNSEVLTALLGIASSRNVLLALIAMLLGSNWLFNLGPYSQLTVFAAGSAPEATLSPALILPDYLLALGDQGREVYWSHLIWDFLNPLLMVSFFLLFLVRFSILSEWTQLLLYTSIFPSLIVLAEVVENVLLLWAVHNFPNPISASASVLLTGATYLKFIAIGLSVFSSLIIGVMALIRQRYN